VNTWKEIENLLNWCDDNNLSLNVSETEEIVINFRKRSGGHAPVYNNGDEVEMVSKSDKEIEQGNRTDWFALQRASIFWMGRMAPFSASHEAMY